MSYARGERVTLPRSDRDIVLISVHRKSIVQISSARFLRRARARGDLGNVGLVFYTFFVAVYFPPRRAEIRSFHSSVGRRRLPPEDRAAFR